VYVQLAYGDGYHAECGRLRLFVVRQPDEFAVKIYDTDTKRYVQEASAADSEGAKKMAVAEARILLQDTGAAVSDWFLCKHPYPEQ